MAAPADGDLGRLWIHARSTVALTPGGRILREGPPDNSDAPRLFFAGCAAGNLALVRHDVGEADARRAEALAQAEPPWFDPEHRPACLDELVALAAEMGPARPAAPALIHRLPNGSAGPVEATIVRSDTIDGEALLDRLARDGMPPHLVEAGFVGLDDFWEPWCAAMVDGEIASMAFAARLGAHGADIGVYTFPAFRGRGLAAAVTAAWSSLPSLSDRTLFYSTLNTNLASRRVAARLGLRRIGVSLRLT